MSRFTPLLSMCLALGALLQSGVASARDSGPPSNTPPLEILHIETDEFFADVVTPNGQVLYARTAALQDGADDGWWLRMDVQVLNTGPAPLTIIGFELDTDASFPDYTPLSAPIVVAPGATRLLFPQDLRGIGPQPGIVGIRIYASGYALPVQRIDQLQQFDADTPSGGYRFPARPEDLPGGIYWGVGRYHTHTESQRYAYDFRNWRQTEDGGWDFRTAEAYNDPAADPGDADEHYIIWGRPVYAMADGVITKCRRLEPDLPPTAGSGGAVNMLYVDHGNGEFALYAHFQEQSIPAELCPEEAPANGANPAHVPVMIHEGQFIGNVGSSGTSTPHLHLHLADGNGDVVPQAAVRGLPLRFHSTDVRDRNGFDPVADAGTWNRLTAAQPAAIMLEHLIMPNPCGWTRYEPGFAEIARHHIPAACYQIVFDAVVSAGYRPVYVDAYTVDGRLFFNAVWRPTAGVSWAAYHGLDGAAYQAKVNDLTGEGFRLTHVESYVFDGTIYYAPIFAKLPGRWVAYHGLLYNDHKTNMDGLKAQGYQPVSLSVVSDGADRRYTALYLREAASWVVRSQIPEADYQATFNTQRAAGRYLRSLQAYEHLGQRYFAAVFSSGVSEPVASHGMTAAKYQQTWDDQTGAGLLTRLVTGYDAGGDPFYAAAWAP